jgi:hypothetical protein
MTVSEIYEVKPANDIPDADSFTEHDMIPALQRYVSPWTFVQAHRSKYIGHGYCASSNAGPDESGRGTAEMLNMPYMRTTQGTGFLQWQFFDPSTDLFPYESRTRWFRTFNDDYMIINYSQNPQAALDNPANFNNPVDLAFATVGGPFHPTAEGHAFIADAIIQAARPKLRIDATNSQK